MDAFSRSHERRLVRAVGIEPTLLAEPDFETCAFSVKFLIQCCNFSTFVVCVRNVNKNVLFSPSLYTTDGTSAQTRSQTASTETRGSRKERNHLSMSGRFCRRSERSNCDCAAMRVRTRIASFPAPRVRKFQKLSAAGQCHVLRR